MITVKLGSLAFLKLNQSSAQTITASPILDWLTGSKVVFTDSNKKLISTGIGTSSQFIKGDGSLDSSTYLADAPSDSSYYSRKNASWVSFTPFTDAPSDGSTYGRKNGAWEVAGGGSQTPWTSDIDAAGYKLSTVGELTVVKPFNPLYTNAGGSGDRTASVTVTCSSALFDTGYDDPTTLVNGVTSTETVLYFKNNNDPTGKYIRFDFGVGASKIIVEAKYYQQTTSNQGTWKWQGSNNGSSWTDIGSTFTLGGVATQTQTTLSANQTGYRYYQLLGTAGLTSDGPWVYEFEFKIANAPYSAITGAGTFQTVNIKEGAAVGYAWKCTNATTGAGAWGAPSGGSLGSANQIPYMNGAGTDYSYSANLTYTGTVLTYGMGTSGTPFSITQGSNNYMYIQTDAFNEKIWFGNGTTNPLYTFYGSGDFSVYGLVKCLGGIVITTSMEPGVDNTNYLGKNSISTPKAWKAVVVKDTTNGNYYRIEVTNGTVVATQIT